MLWFMVALMALAACGGSDSIPQAEPAAGGETFGWDAEAFESYAFTYTQVCGLNFVAEEPTSAWVVGSQPPRNLSDLSRDVPSIPDLLAVVSGLSDGFELTEFTEGDFGQPERITIERTGDERSLFCLELLDFDGSNRDDGDRLAVPATGDFAVSADGMQIFLDVPACKGDPAAIVAESESSVTFRLVARIPDIQGGDDCGDTIALDLETPLGARRVIDDFGGRVLEPQGS